MKKSILVTTCSLLLGLLFLGISGWFIFNNDAMTGMLWAIGLWLVPFAFFIISLVALTTGKIPRLGINSRWGAAALSVFTLLIGASIVVFAFANVFVIEAGIAGNNPVEKVRWYGKLTGQASLQQDLERVEGAHATYFVTPENRDKVEEMERILPFMEAQVDEWLPPAPEDSVLEIELHRNASTMQLLQEDAGLGGFYSTLSERMHVHDNHPLWKDILIHEYTHFRVHQYQQQQTGKAVTLPHWLEEGTAEMMTGSLQLGPFDAYRALPLEEAHERQSLEAYREQNMDIYAYANIMVTELSRKAGKDKLQQWLLTSDPNELEQEIRTLYGVSEDAELQKIIIDQYQEKLNENNSHMNVFMNADVAEWKEAWELYKSNTYSPFHSDGLRTMYFNARHEFQLDIALEILAKLEQLDFYRPASYFEGERALIMAGKGDLDQAIAIYEKLPLKAEISYHDDPSYERLHVLRLLRDNPHDPAIAEWFTDKSLFGLENDKKWLSTFQ